MAACEGGSINNKTVFSVGYLWKNEYTEFRGPLHSLKYTTTGVRLFLDEKVNIYSHTRPNYCFSFSQKENFNEVNSIYIRYVGFGKSDTSAHCIVYAEQEN